MRFVSLILCSVFLTLVCISQNKTPLAFKLQDKFVTKRVHKYLRYDTIIETSKAKIHVHYSNDKNKPYLLLLHGIGGNARLNWYKQVGYLSKHYNLILPDLIYFGSSTAKENNYTVQFQVEQMKELIKILDIHTKINIMGFSYGGLTSALYNQLYPSEINKLIIIDGPVKFYDLRLSDSLANSVGAKSMVNIILPQTIKEFKVMEKAVLSKKPIITKKLKIKFINYYLLPNIKTRQEQLNHLNDYQKEYQNYNYNLETTPTLLLWGAKDGVVPLSVGKKLHALFPNTTELIVYPKAKHDTHYRYYKKLNKAIISFLTK